MASGAGALDDVLGPEGQKEQRSWQETLEKNDFRPRLLSEQSGNLAAGLNEEAACLRKRYQIPGGSGWPRQPAPSAQSGGIAAAFGMGRGLQRAQSGEPAAAFRVSKRLQYAGLGSYRIVFAKSRWKVGGVRAAGWGWGGGCINLLSSYLQTLETRRGYRSPGICPRFIYILLTPHIRIS